MKIDKTVWKETAYVAIGTFIMSAVMVGVYSVISPFKMEMLYGALFGSVASILNFFFMAYTLQKAVEINAEGGEDKEEKMKLKVKASYSVRSMIYVFALAVALISKKFNIITLLVPALFPQIVARIRMYWLKKHGE